MASKEESHEEIKDQTILPHEWVKNRNLNDILINVAAGIQFRFLYFHLIPFGFIFGWVEYMIAFGLSALEGGKGPLCKKIEMSTKWMKW